MEDGTHKYYTILPRSAFGGDEFGNLFQLGRDAGLQAATGICQTKLDNTVLIEFVFWGKSLE